MRYRARIISSDGGIVSELHEGRRAEEVRARLVAAGAVVLSVRPAWPVFASGLSGAKDRDVHLVFCDQLRTLLEAGISVAESLAALRDSETDDDFRTVLSAILGDIESGQPLSAALARQSGQFPGILLSMLKAAEKTGALTDALARYGHFRRQFDEFRDKLWAAATYPLLLLGAGGCVVTFLMLYVVPRFSLVYRDLHGPLPWTARLLLAWGEFAEGRTSQLLVAFALTAALLVFIWRQPSWRAAIVARVARLPYFGDLFREVQLSHYFHSLGLLLTAGIPLHKALELGRDILAAGMREAAEAVAMTVRQGGRLSSGLERNGLATPVALRLIQAGERSGQLAEMLSRAALFHDRRILHATEMLSRIVGPALMALMGLLIGGIVVLLYMPIFQLAEGLT